MSSWNRARIKYQYSPDSDTSHRSIDSVTMNIFGKSESAVLSQLRKSYPTRTDFVILELDWDEQDEINDFKVLQDCNIGQHR